MSGTLFFAVALELSACSGGSRSTQALAVGQGVLPNIVVPATMQPGQHNPSAEPVSVQLSYVLPTLATQAHAHRNLLYISSSNTLMSITVTPLGGSGTVYGPSACTSGTCTVSFTAMPGPNTIAFTLTDGSSNVLSKFSTTTIVQPTTLNSLNFTANPVVNSVVVNLASTSIAAGTPADDLVTINAKDIDGNTIAGNGNYIDVNGNPIVLALSASNSQAGGQGTVSIHGSGRITSSNQPLTYAHYDGNWLDHSDITVTCSSGAVSTLTGTTLTTVPSIIEYSSGLSASAQPAGITRGPDGNLWFGETGYNKIGRITPKGAITEFSTGISAGAQTYSLGKGSDGNIWFDETNLNKIGRITPSGTVTEFSSNLSGGANPDGMVAGSDGNLWFAEYMSFAGNKIGQITPSGLITEFSAGITAGAAPTQIALGNDGKLWFTEQAAAKIGTISPSGVVTEYSTGITAGSSPFSITNGADGNIWFSEFSGNKIGRITLNGVVTEFSTGISAGANIREITSGPDGNLWFAENAANKIGRITTSGVVTEYTVPTGGSGPWGIVAGSDGAIWFTEIGGSKIGRLIL